LTGLVTRIIGHHSIYGCAGGIFDRFCFVESESVRINMVVEVLHIRSLLISKSMASAGLDRKTERQRPLRRSPAPGRRIFVGKESGVENFLSSGPIDPNCRQHAGTEPAEIEEREIQLWLFAKAIRCNLLRVKNVRVRQNSLKSRRAPHIALGD
jgi:hypothetical protein